MELVTFKQNISDIETINNEISINGFKYIFTELLLKKVII